MTQRPKLTPIIISPVPTSRPTSPRTTITPSRSYGIISPRTLTSQTTTSTTTPKGQGCYMPLGMQYNTSKCGTPAGGTDDVEEVVEETTVTETIR